MGKKIDISERKVDRWEVSDGIAGLISDVESLQWVLDNAEWIFEGDDDDVARLFPCAHHLFDVVCKLLSLQKDKLEEVRKLYGAFIEGLPKEGTGAGYGVPKGE